MLIGTVHSTTGLAIPFKQNTFKPHLAPLALATPLSKADEPNRVIYLYFSWRLHYCRLDDANLNDNISYASQ